jgi:hypothetical protein
MRDPINMIMSIPFLIRSKSTVPVSQRLNDWIIERTKHIKHEVVSYEFNDSFEELKRTYTETGVIIVNDLHGDKTIYGDRRVNALARVWHDYHHVMLDTPFDQLGETRTAFSQIAELPDDWHFERMLVLCDIIGQTTYHSVHGCFVDDQRKFTAALMTTGRI